MAKKLEKMLAILLALSMCMSLLSFQALAADGTETTTNPDGTTTVTTTTTTETTGDNGNVTVVVTIEKDTDGTIQDSNTVDGVMVDKDELRTETTVKDENGKQLDYSWVEEGTEIKEWTEADSGDSAGQPPVTVDLKPGEPTTGTASTTTTTGDVPTSETDTEYDYTTTTTTDRTVTATTSEVKVTVNDSSTGLVGEQKTELTPLVPVYDEVDGVKEDKVGVNDGSFLKLYFTQDPSTWEVPDGGEYRYVGYGEDGKYYSATVQVYYEKDESGNTVYDENGNPVIEDIRTVAGTNVTIGGEDAFTLDAGHQLSPYNGALPGTLQLMDKEGNSVFAYCCDIETQTVDGYWYSVSNLEDSDYYASEDAENHIRSIALNGYWGTSDIPKEDGTYETGSLESIKAKLKAAIANGEIDGVFEMTCFTENGKLAYDENGKPVTEMVNMLEIIDGLTAGEALTATQAAIWSYSNGNQDALNGTDGKVIVAPDYRANHKTSNSDALDDYGGARIDFLYNWLMNLETEEESTIVINEKNFFEGMSLTVGDKVADHENNLDDNQDNDVYNTDLNFTLAFVPGEKDDLLVQITYTDLDGNPVNVVRRLAGANSEGQTYEDIKPEDDGSYVLRGLKLSENKDFEFDLRLEGTQYLEQGVYVYSPIGGRGSSQTAVGVAEGTKAVDVSMSVTVSFDVDENNQICATRTWRDEGPDYYGDDDDDDDDIVIGDDDDDDDLIDIGEGDTPLVNAPESDESLVDLPDEEIPLASVPKTGDASALWLALSALSGSGLLGLTLIGKKREEE